MHFEAILELAKLLELMSILIKYPIINIKESLNSASDFSEVEGSSDLLGENTPESSDFGELVSYEISFLVLVEGTF